MGTLSTILVFTGAAILLLLGAVAADKLMQRRAKQRREAEAAGTLEKKRDAADAVIELLGRTGDIVRSLQAGKDEEEDKPSTT